MFNNIFNSIIMFNNIFNVTIYICDITINTFNVTIYICNILLVAYVFLSISTKLFLLAMQIS